MYLVKTDRVRTGDWYPASDVSERYRREPTFLPLELEVMKLSVAVLPKIEMPYVPEH
jgi:hypothetical protein